MNKNYLRAIVQRAEGGGDKAGDPIRFIASTEGIKRDGIDLRANDWYLDNYKKNPVFLWAHDYFGRNLPLGRVDAFVNGSTLVADVVFDQGDEFAKQVERKYRDGFLHTVSVGWDFVEIDQRRRMDLLDVSGVPVPGDPDALIQRTIDTLNEYVNPAASSKEEDDWQEVSAAMVGVFSRSSDDSDEERLRVYKSLLPKYRRLDKVAPEFRTNAELQNLEEADITALFLEGEMGEGGSQTHQSQRAGAVLSSRNRDDLQQAIGLIQSVLERASKEGEGGSQTPQNEPRSVEGQANDDPDAEGELQIPQGDKSRQNDQSLEALARGIQLNLQTRSLK